MNNLNNTHNTDNRGVAMNIFAVLGFIAILLAGLWATIQLVKQVTNYSFDFATPKLSLPGFNSGDKLSIKNTTNGVNTGGIAIKSGEESIISWELGKNFTDDTTGAFSFSYACTKGVYLKTKKTPTDSYQAIPCNTPYALEAKSTKITLVPVASDSNMDDMLHVAYTIAYTNKDGEQLAHGQMTVDTNNITKLPIPSTVASTTKPAGTHLASTPTPKKVLRKLVPVRKSNPNGRPDLAIKILSVLPTTTPGKVSVKFEVANLGTKLVNGWNFTAQLPTTPAYAYTSGPQVPLYAGERAELVLTFDKLAIGNGQLTITLDALNAVTESSENNNVASQIIVGK